MKFIIAEQYLSADLGIKCDLNQSRNAKVMGGRNLFMPLREVWLLWY